jgi:hypothetical protein
VDGIYTEPADAEMIYVTVAQRWSVIVTAKNDTNSNFAFVGSMDEVRTAAACLIHFICLSYLVAAHWGTVVLTKPGSFRRRS